MGTEEVHALRRDRREIRKGEYVPSWAFGLRKSTLMT